MKYEYECLTCHKRQIIDKKIEEVDRIEHCQLCGSYMKRVYDIPIIWGETVAKEG